MYSTNTYRHTYRDGRSVCRAHKLIVCLLNSQKKRANAELVTGKVEEERRKRMGEGVEDRHWRPANVDESCLAHPVAMDTVRSSSQHV